MTVAELISKLQDVSPSSEVMLALEVDDEVYDAPPLAVYVQAGYVFVSAAE